MEKYKTEFKFQVVNCFLAREGGAKLLARQWSVPEEKIHAWFRLWFGDAVLLKAARKRW